METINVNCGLYQEYELILKPKYGAKEIELPEQCTITITPIETSTCSDIELPDAGESLQHNTRNIL